MGYWGYFIAAKDERKANELNCLAGIRDRLNAGELRSRGWQVWEHPGEPGIDASTLAMALAQETRAPVLIGFVMDSDCVVIEGAGPESGQWRACLGPQMMAGYLSEGGQRLEDWFLAPEDAASRASAWAREAGGSVDAASLVETFSVDVQPWAQEKFFDLLDKISLS